MKIVHFDSLESNDEPEFDAKGNLVFEGTIVAVRGPLKDDFYEIDIRLTKGKVSTIALNKNQFEALVARMHMVDA